MYNWHLPARVTKYDDGTVALLTRVREVITKPTVIHIAVALQALTNIGLAEQPPLAVFPDCTRRYWVDMWSAHRIPQLHFQLSKPDRYIFIQ
jgi:hypothetical protein